MQRRLYWHAFLQILAALLMGVAIPAFRNPRMALTAHVGTLMGGLLVGVTGACWNHLAATDRERGYIFWLTVFSSYMNGLGLTLAAVLGTSHSTPIAGAGFSATASQDLLVDLVLVLGAVPTVAAVGLVLRALGGRRAPARAH
jgi:(hydroxyamino)benzene mutase